MSKIKKVLCLVLSLIMVLALCSACSGGDNQPKRDPDYDEFGNKYAGVMEEEGNTYAQPGWLPIVKTPITVSAIVRDPRIAGNVYSDRTIWKEIEDKTNIKIDLQVTTTTEPEALIFASRNYPDMAFRIYVDTQYKEACYSGDILQLTDEMLETYAPGWYDLFLNNPEVYKLTLQPDGKLYSLPQWVMEESTYELRDMNVINETWLDELGLSMPTTVNEFTDYLRAVKNARGTGSIPEDAIPLYLMASNVASANNIGCQNTIFDWFGVYQGYAYEIVENGVVKNNAKDAAMKPAIKYIEQLNSENLINENAVKNVSKWTEYQTALGSDYDGVKKSVYIGSYFGYAINDVYKDDFAAFAPLDATANGATEGPYCRSFGAENRIIKNAFCIFSTSAYPVALLRLADTFGTGEGALRAVIGEEGKQWEKLSDGTYKYAETAWNLTNDTNAYGWNDTAFGVVTADVVEQLVRDSMGEDADPDDRIYLYYNLYRDYIPTDKKLYPKDALNYLSVEENTLCDQILARIETLNSTYFRKWVSGETSVDDEWDEYQQKLKVAGIDDRIALMQKAYDAYMEAKIN